MIEEATAVEKLRDELLVTSVRLSSAVALSNYLLTLVAPHLDADQTSLLNVLLPPIVDDFNAEQGWEEIVNVNTAHLLRTCLSKKTTS